MAFIQSYPHVNKAPLSLRRQGFMGFYDTYPQVDKSKLGIKSFSYQHLPEIKKKCLKTGVSPTNKL